MNDKMKHVNPVFDEIERVKDARWFVFNLTDGIEAHPGLMTLDEAVEFMTGFPKRFEEQGYYKTSLSHRIPPEQVQLVLLPADDMTRLAVILTEFRKRRGGR